MTAIRNNVVPFPGNVLEADDDRPMLPATAVERSPELTLITAILKALTVNELANVIRDIDGELCATGATDGHARADYRLASGVLNSRMRAGGK